MYHTSGGVAREGWGYTLGERRRRQGSGQVSRRADTSGADLRVFEPSRYTPSSHSGIVVVLYRRATRGYGRVRRIVVVVATSWCHCVVPSLSERSGCIIIAGCISRSLTGHSRPFLPRAKKGAIASSEG